MASYKKHGTGWEYRLRYKDPFTQKFREKAQRGFDSKKKRSWQLENLKESLLLAMNNLIYRFKII